MPIGKNSIKRVKDGYSKVETSAPDMENSTVLTNPAPEVIALVTPTTEKSAPAKRGRKPSAAKKAAPKAAASKKTAPTTAAKAPVTVDARPDGFIRVALGDDMPTYLL